MLLDTNVLSELMRPAPAAVVLDWFAGQRKAALNQASQAMFDVDFKDHVLPFDCGTARAYAQIVARRSAQGRPISTEDAQIAATAVQHHLPLVTRNTRDFELIPDLQLINPWSP